MTQPMNPPEASPRPARARSSRARIATVIAGSAIVLGAGGAALANAQGSSSPLPSTSQSAPLNGTQSNGDQSTNTPQGAGRHGGRGGAEMAAELATKLGLDQTTVHNALDSVRQDERAAHATQAKPTTPPTAAERAQREAAMAQALAAKLGVDQQKVVDALSAIRTEHQATEKQELSTRLDAAVSAGTLTAADKASVLKAVDAGVLGGPGGPGGH